VAGVCILGFYVAGRVVKHGHPADIGYSILIGSAAIAVAIWFRVRAAIVILMASLLTFLLAWRLLFR
jgi:hypothetical protein